MLYIAATKSKSTKSHYNKTSLKDKYNLCSWPLIFLIRRTCTILFGISYKQFKLSKKNIILSKIKYNYRKITYDINLYINIHKKKHDNDKVFIKTKTKQIKGQY